MQPDKVIKFLKKLGVKVPAAQVRTGWILSSCPMAPWTHKDGKSNSASFGVKKEPGNARTRCFVCDYHGRLGELVVEMHHKNKLQPHYKVKWGDLLEMIEEAEEESVLQLDSPDIEEMLFGPKATLHEFPDWWLSTFPSVMVSNAACKYLADRNVPAAIGELLDLRWDSKQGRICFPVRDFSERCVGLHGRALDDKVDPRYRMYTHAKKNNPVVWLGESWVDTSKPIVVVEGPFDLANTLRVYRNTVCPLFSTPSLEKLNRMRDCFEWITFLDNGTGGDAGRDKIWKTMANDHVVHHITPPEGRKDPGVCSVEEISELLKPLVKLDKLIS